jgi:hypothetical protein
MTQREYNEHLDALGQLLDRCAALGRERDEAQRAALELAERLEPTPAELSEFVRRWPWLLRFADGDPPDG